MDKQNKAALYALAGGIIWSFSGLFSRMVSWNSFTLVALRALVAAVILVCIYASSISVAVNL